MHVNAAPQEPASASGKLMRAAAVLISGAILLYVQLPTRMLTSEKTFKYALYPAMALFAVFYALWFYTAVFLQANDVFWYQTHAQLVPFATGCALIGSFLWIIGMWPELHLWTLPIYVLCLMFIANLSGLIPVRKPKTHKL